MGPVRECRSGKPRRIQGATRVVVGADAPATHEATAPIGVGSPDRLANALLAGCSALAPADEIVHRGRVPLERREMIRRLVVVLAAVALAACGEGAGPDSARCSSASDAMLQAIGAGLTVDGATLTSGFVVRSEQFEEVYLVAAEIDGPGLEGIGDVGVWATNDTAGGGSILSVDDTAKERSSWPIGSDANEELTIMADGAMEAEACAGG